ALKSVLAAHRDVDAFVALCEQTRLNSADCLSVARILKGRCRLEETLAWVERGLAIAAKEQHSFCEYDLRKLKRALLLKLKRPEDALASAWSDFQEQPSRFSYQELMRYVPAGNKKV
ncbi:MAG: hypothetical protein V2A76_13915, partial [Planctomycetota bacterium]